MTIQLLLFSSILYHALVGAIGSVVCFLTYAAFAWLFSYINKKINGSNKSKDDSNQPEEEQEAQEDKGEDAIAPSEISSTVQEGLFCLYCGRPIENYAKFCPHCGKEQVNTKNTNIEFLKVSDSSKKFFKALYYPFIKWCSSIKIGKVRNACLSKWVKRILTIAITLFFVWIVAICISWCYCRYMVTKWNSYDEEQIKLAQQNPTQADKIATILLNEEHQKEDLVGDPHYCNNGSHTNLALSILETAARKGNVKCMILLGRYYKYGLFKSYKKISNNNLYAEHKNYDKSSYWFLLAAQRGDSEGQGEIGHNYKCGIGVKQNFYKAYAWLKKGADNGDPVAQWRFGNINCSGIGYYTKYFSDSDYNTWWYDGVKFYALGNSNESVTNENAINEMLQSGPEEIIFPRNIAIAKKYWNMAARHGLKIAKESLEKIYEED